MARKLRDVKLDEISFVGKGDNPEAHVLLLKMKSEDGFVANPIVKLGKAYAGRDKDKILKDWLTVNADRISKEDDALTFDQIIANREVKDKVWSMIWTLEDSISSIMCDDSVTDKAAMIQTSVEQFRTAITPISKGEEQMPQELKKAQDALAASEAKVAELTKTVEDVTKENDTLKACAAEDKKKLDELNAGKVKKEEEDVLKGLPESVVKEMKDNRDRIAKMEENELTREYVGKAAEVALVGKADSVGTLLKSIAKHSTDLAGQVFDLFKSANARIAEGDLLKEKGDNANDGVATAYDKIVAKAADLRKSCPELSEAQAFTKVYDTDADLRTAYLAERA